MSDPTNSQDNGTETAAATISQGELLAAIGAGTGNFPAPLPVEDFKVPGIGPVTLTPNIGVRSSRLPHPIEFSVPSNPNAMKLTAEGDLQVTYYKHPLGSCRYIFKDGKAANFVNHIYATTDINQIAELDAEAHHIGLLKATGILDPRELTDPLVALRNKFYREFLEDQRLDRLRANNPDNDAGTNLSAGPRVNAAGTKFAITSPEAMAAAAAGMQATAGNAKTFPLPAVSSPGMQSLLTKLAAK